MAISYGPNIGQLIDAADGEAHAEPLRKLLRALDLLVMCRIDAVVDAPPGSPTDGKAVIVGASPSGAFVGHANAIARYSTAAAAWEFYTPLAGWTAEITSDPDARLRFDGDSWETQELAIELPPGGTTGQLLAKNSGSDYDVEWTDPPESETGLPTGGTTGQVLAKNSGTDGDVEWVTPSAPFSAVDNNSVTSRNLDNTHVGTYMRFMSASAKTVTVQSTSYVTYPADAEFHIRNVGAGDLTIVAGDGTTVYPPAGGTLVLQTGMAVTIKKVAGNEFDVIGQTVAA